MPTGERPRGWSVIAPDEIGGRFWDAFSRHQGLESARFPPAQAVEEPESSHDSQPPFS